ncbi:MAG: cysteine desulfurase [Cryomorphaceae bacterium]|jgi:cysteine desulfurase|nr:cysteine desulfurase [Cryomorphaceae bacterium]
MQIYLDNAATTAIDPAVVETMTRVLTENFGNPSSSHSKGREAKALIETSRRSIAKWLNCEPSELIFTSGGTEADNMAIFGCIEYHGVKRIITSRLEHHAIGHTVEIAAKNFDVEIDYVNVDSKGNVDLSHLEELLKKDNRTLVSLMYANNEIGTLLPIDKVVVLCKTHNAFFHSDTVQGIGHYAFDLKNQEIDFLTCSAHKFHGPKGVGFLYARKKSKFGPLLHGGSQERGNRGGTENVAGICGMATAFELAYSELESHQNHIRGIKNYFVERLNTSIEGIYFNGEISDEKSLYTVLNVSFPPFNGAGLLLFTLDLKGIAASGGSACSSGASSPSHVLSGIGADFNRPNVRFSFSKFTNRQEIDYTIEKIVEIFKS